MVGILVQTEIWWHIGDTRTKLRVRVSPFFIFMAESILTSINLAGGSFNVYYDTVLSVISVSNASSKSCPSGWKAAVVISHKTRSLSNSESWIVLCQPIIIFNVNSNSINYYGTYIYEDAAIGTCTAYNGITISQSAFNFNTNYSGNTINYGTIIFVA